jgi:hypothetical protein
MREYKIMPSSALLLSVEQAASVLGLGRTRTYELDEAIAPSPDLFESAIQRIHEMAPAISM